MRLGWTEEYFKKKPVMIRHGSRIDDDGQLLAPYSTAVFNYTLFFTI